MTSLYYDAPAGDWLEALPLGNGALGAMCWGGAAVARFDLNDETAWSGSIDSEARQGGVDGAQARELLAEARALIAAGRPVDAEAAVQRLQSAYTQAYLPFGTLEVRLPFEPTGDYRRSLDLAEAVHTVTSGTATSGAVARSAVVQRTIASHVHGVLMHIIDGLPTGALPGLELSSPLAIIGDNSGGDTGGTLLVRLPSDVAPGHETDYPPVSWDDAPGASLEGAIVTRVVAETTADGSHRAVVFLATGTTYSSPTSRPIGTADDVAASASARIDAAVTAGSDRVLADHIADHTALFARVSIDLGRQDTTTPSDVRIERAAAHPGGALAADPSLAALLFDYGRYLLISSSRAGGLPANLQGIWNDRMQPPWSSNYTTNINLQMNYWGADVANLAETAEPLVDFVEALAEAGRSTAQRLYAARGWVTHHNSDAWAYTAPVGGGHGDPSWAFWPLAGPWLVRHLADRIGFGDTELRRRAWPVMRGAAEFALDYMVRQPDGSWGTSPSTSPENRFVAANGGPASLGTSSTMDISLLRELFDTVVDAARALGIGDDPVALEAAARLSTLPAAPAITQGGLIREWCDDPAAVDPHHRHVSHLYGLYPGTEPFDAAHREAATRSLVDRGDDSTGWSLAWKLALWARLGRPDKVSDLLRLVFRPAATTTGPFAGGLYPNLFAAHPPFQIDGNLGFVAALAEALLQSHRGRIELLPAVPAELATGRVTGLVARPGILVDLEWRDGRLVEATLLSRKEPVVVCLRYRDRDVTRTVDRTHGIRITPTDFNESDTAA